MSTVILEKIDKSRFEYLVKAIYARIFLSKADNSVKYYSTAYKPIVLVLRFSLLEFNVTSSFGDKSGLCLMERCQEKSWLTQV